MEAPGTWAAGRLRRLTEDLDDAERLLETLALAVEARDGTTGDHCARLRSAGIGFGTYLGLPMPDVKGKSYVVADGDVMHFRFNV